MDIYAESEYPTLNNISVIHQQQLIQNVDTFGLIRCQWLFAISGVCYKSVLRHLLDLDMIPS